MVVSAAAITPVWGAAADLSGVGWPVAPAAAFGDAAAVAVAAAATDAFVVAVAVAAMVVACADGVPSAAVADWLAAMAAAAIASGAVPLVDPGAAVAGVAVTVVVTGMTTATATGVAAEAVVPFCDVVSVGPVVEAEVEVSVEEPAVGFVESSFEAEGLLRERGGASVLLAPLASEAGLLLAFWLPELSLLLLAGWFAGAVLFRGLLFAADELLSGQFCEADVCCAWVAALLASAAALLLTRLAKLSLPCEWSATDLAGLGGAF
jgi:hypothetical protein